MGMFDRWRRRRPVPAVQQPIDLGADDGLDEELLRAWIVPGFTAFEDVVTSATEMLEDAGSDTGTARSRVRAVWDARVRELTRADPARPSDHDRLAEAFDVLEREHGFVTAMAAGFDRGELWERLRERRRDTGGTAWAGAGFHEQDAEHLAESPTVLYLLYSVFAPAPGSTPEPPAGAALTEAEQRERATADAAIAGGLLLGALRTAGLEATWNGSPASRIQVHVTDWRRPLPVD